MGCRFCGRNTKLIEPHIIPEGLSRPLRAVRKAIPKNKTGANLESEAHIWQMAEVLRGSLDAAESRKARVTVPRVPPPFEPKDNEC